ncbi:hypothetical protein, partial [Algibacter sp. L4_22]|uniref:hypothetical protein n=1 Tax=Algibacter sp. L4_22 TaxID=2942477 RepID=UPI00201B9676
MFVESGSKTFLLLQWAKKSTPGVLEVSEEGLGLNNSLAHHRRVVVNLSLEVRCNMHLLH